MNKTKIEWTDFSWNPITGCTRDCSYCYAKKMANRLKGRNGYNQENPFCPTFHENRLNEPLQVKKPSKIFTCSMGDFFDPNVCEDWRESIYEVIEQAPQHQFQILTKQVIIEPKYRDRFPDNVWVGVSIDGSSNYWVNPLKSLHHSSARIKFVSFEPLIGDVIPNTHLNLDWAIIGAQTGPGAKPPDSMIVDNLMANIIEWGIPFFIKPNIRKHLPNGECRPWLQLEDFPIKFK